MTMAIYMGVSSQRHAPPAHYPRESIRGTHWIGGWVGIRSGLDTEARGKIHCLCRRLNPDRPVCSHTRYSLSCPSSKTDSEKCKTLDLYIIKSSWILAAVKLILMILRHTCLLLQHLSTPVLANIYRNTLHLTKLVDTRNDSRRCVRSRFQLNV
jgi:hypothetical protein